MNEAKVRAEIDRLHVVAVQWAAKSRRASEDGHHMDAARHMRRGNECVLKANQLKQTLTAD